MKGHRASKNGALEDIEQEFGSEGQHTHQTATQILVLEGERIVLEGGGQSRS